MSHKGYEIADIDGVCECGYPLRWKTVENIHYNPISRDIFDRYRFRRIYCCVYCRQCYMREHGELIEIHEPYYYLITAIYPHILQELYGTEFDRLLDTIYSKKARVVIHKKWHKLSLKPIRRIKNARVEILTLFNEQLIKEIEDQDVKPTKRDRKKPSRKTR